MAIEYTEISSADKANILKQRILQFEAEAYQHEINKEMALVLGDDSLVEQADAALETIENAINLHRNLLDNLGA